MKNLSNCSLKVQKNTYEVNKKLKKGEKRRKPPLKEKKENYFYHLEFDVNNGLMSGWKLTSIFGSLFNLTLNKLSE